MIVIVLWLLIYIIIPIVLIGKLIEKSRDNKYNKSGYKDASKNSYKETMSDAGKYGEYLTYTYLEKLNINKRLMTNLYIPKKDGSTTEIDLIMITETGLYVIESKNYSGWIFGNEKDRNWTQTLKSNQKYQFLNPIWQNKGHINALKEVLNLEDSDLLKSIIVFSERCELKSIKTTSPNVLVIKRNNLINTVMADVVKSKKILTRENIEQIYLKLHEFAFADEETKARHIKNIQVKNKSNYKTSIKVLNKEIETNESELIPTSNTCVELHKILNSSRRYDYTNIDSIPFTNGIYVMFERGEKYNGIDRVVRVGTHIEDGGLIDRIREHYILENKNRSIFRKHLGLALLYKDRDPYTNIWNADTSKNNIIEHYKAQIDEVKELNLEKRITRHINSSITFTCIPINSREERLRFEEGILTTLNKASDFKPSQQWLGLNSPISNISKKGLWNAGGLTGIELQKEDIEVVRHLSK